MIGADKGAAAAAHAFERRERHQERAVVGEAHHLARHGAMFTDLDIDAPADRHRAERPGDLDQKAAHGDDPAVNLTVRNIARRLNEALHLAACLPPSS